MPGSAMCFFEWAVKDAVMLRPSACLIGNGPVVFENWRPTTISAKPHG